jgi:hypothetical protein
LGIYWYTGARRNSYLARDYIQSRIAEADIARPEISQVPDKWLTDPDLQNLIILNRTQIGVYQDIATGDAKRAARSSQIAMSIGFLRLVVGAVVAVRASDSTSKIVVDLSSCTGPSYDAVELLFSAATCDELYACSRTPNAEVERRQSTPAGAG